MEGLPTRLQISNQYLVYFNVDYLLVFNFTSDVWSRYSLDFCQLEGCTLLKFAASDGGLLCLITECGEFLVCYPFTECYTKLPKPPQGLFEDSLLSSVGIGHEHVTRDFAVEMVVRSHTGHFRLVLAIISLNVRRTFVFDSLDNYWREVEDSTKGMHFFFTWPTAKCMGNLYLTGVGSPGRCIVLKYNPEEERWKSIETSHNGTHIPVAILAKDGTVLMGSVATDNRLIFFEIHDIGLTLRLVPSLLFEWPFVPCRVPLAQWNQECSAEFEMTIGGEDFAVSVRVRKRSQAKESHILVWMHNFVDGSNKVSCWQELGEQPDIFPLPENFHRFKPTSTIAANIGS